MRIAALVLWVMTACVGLYLLSTWLSRGVRQRAAKLTRYPVILIALHPVFAATGLGFWVTYVLTAQVRFAWMSFGMLSGSALLGFALLTRWLTARGGRHVWGAGRHFPRNAVVLHGVVGVATFVLVLITATIASRP